MVNASELRIGNWAVNYGNYVCIEADDIVDCHHQPESYDPIPLTPEILEKAGFTGGDWFFTINNIISFSHTDTEGLWKTWVVGDNSIGNIHFVHQLQNLYYALTGQELPIEL